MIFKLLAAIFFALGGSFCGICCSGRLKNRADICNDSVRIMRSCGIMIRSSGADVYKLMLELKKTGVGLMHFIEKMPDIYTETANFRSLWADAVSSESGIPAEEKKLLIDFGNILGTTDIEGQISSISAQITLMEGLREQRMAEYRQKGRLYRSLGVMAGVMIGIIII